MSSSGCLRQLLVLCGLALLHDPAAAQIRFCLSGNDCADGRFCTVDTCVAGLCVRTDRICADLNIQCTVDRCNESFNRCDNIVVVGTPCEDFNPVTTNDRCDAQGECRGDLPPLSCETSNDCPGNEVCANEICSTRTPTRTPINTLPIAATATRTRTPTRTRTHTRTATHTRTHTATPTRSENPAITPTAVPSPTPTASPTSTPTDPVAPETCPGDCNGDNVVAVNELVLGVNIALDRAALAACPALDQNGNDRVEVNELVDAVGSATRGCASAASP